MKSNKASSGPGQMYPIPAAAAQLGISAKTFRDWCEAGKVNIHRIGGHSIRISQAEIDRIIEESYCPARRTA